MTTSVTVKSTKPPIKLVSERSGITLVIDRSITTTTGGGSGTVTNVSGTAPISVTSPTTTPAISISEATTSAAGSMSAAQVTKLDSVTSGAAVSAVSGSLPVLITGSTAAPTVTVNAATTSLPGTLSAADKTKLDSVTSGAAVSAVSGTAPIISSGGAAPAISISAATTSAPGSLSAADKVKLDGLGAGASYQGRREKQTYIGPAGLVGYGLANNTYASTPDSAVLDIVGDIDLVARASCNDWSTATNQCFIAKRFVALNDSFRFQTYNNNFMFLWTENGTTVKQADGTFPLPFTDGQTGWVRVTLDVDNGSGYTVTFYTAPDSPTEPTLASWTVNSTVTVTGPATSIFSGTSPVEFGSNAGGANQIVGTLSRAIVRNGIGGTIVCDADFEAAQDDALAFTESSSNAASVTVTTGRYTYGIPNATFTTAGTQSLSGNNTHYMPFEVTAPTSVDMFVVKGRGNTVTGSLRVGIFTADEALQPTGSCLAQAEIPFTLVDTLYTKQITALTLAPGVYLMAFNPETSSTWTRGTGGISPLASALGANLFSARIFAGSQTMTGDYTTGPVWDSTTDATHPHIHAAFLRWKAPA
jgi:hypothetical protein